MPVPKVLVFDRIAGKWLGKRPKTWLANFSHLSQTDEAGERSHGAPHSPIEAATPATTITAAPAVSITEEKEDGDAQDAR